MTITTVLAKEKVVSLSALQKNPSRALDADIVRITKNGEDIGIFFKRDEFVDLIEDQLALKDGFKKELAFALKGVKRQSLKKLV